MRVYEAIVKGWKVLEFERHSVVPAKMRLE